MSLDDDGYLTPEIGSWGEDKYRLVRNYADLFATSMKRKWDARIYIDLFAGAGRARIKRSGRIVLGTPLLAMEIRDPYDKYIFCEENDPKMKALQKRVQLGYRSFMASRESYGIQKMMKSKSSSKIIGARNWKSKVSHVEKSNICFSDILGLDAEQCLEKRSKTFVVRSTKL